MFLTIVTINQAKALMTLGFDEECKNFYQEVQSLSNPADYSVSLIKIESNQFASPVVYLEVNKNGYYERANIPAPNMAQVVDWLKINFGIKLDQLQSGADNFCYCIRSPKERKYTHYVNDPTAALYMGVTIALDMVTELI